MTYEIKIEKAHEEQGTVDLGRLSKIAESILRISEGALNIRLKGISHPKGRKSDILHDALRVSLTGINQGSTILSLSSKKFEETLNSYQLDLFRQEAQKELSQHTPVSLFINSFMEAMDDTSGMDFIDKQLLGELKKFQKAFQNDNEVFIISNKRTTPLLEIKKQDFKKIRTLEEKLPEPEPVVINGKVEELKHSKLKVKIETSEGIVDGFLSEEIPSDKIASYWGKNVTVTGNAHYKPGERMTIEIDKIFEPDTRDQYFSKKPSTETVEQQIQRQQREKGTKNQLSDIVGKWPGDEDFEKLINMLNK